MTARASSVIAAAFEQLSDIVGLTTGTDFRELATNAQPPRIVASLLSATPAPIQDPGRRTDGTRPVFTRLVQLSAHCWGDSVEEAEDLVHRFGAALRTSTHGSFAYQGETWATQGDRPAWLKRGELVVAIFAIAIPVTDSPPRATATVTTTPFDNPGAPPAGQIQAPEG